MHKKCHFQATFCARPGTTWTEAEVKASTFGVLIRDDDATACALNFDHLQVAIDYTTPVTGGKVRLSLLGVGH